MGVSQAAGDGRLCPGKLGFRWHKSESFNQSTYVHVGRLSDFSPFIGEFDESPGTHSSVPASLLWQQVSLRFRRCRHGSRRVRSGSRQSALRTKPERNQRQRIQFAVRFEIFIFLKALHRGY